MIKLLIILGLCVFAENEDQGKGKAVTIEFMPMPNPLDRDVFYYVPVFVTNRLHEPVQSPPHVTR